jgi:glycosyltransferase involved in cell wall biosynthesis
MSEGKRDDLTVGLLTGGDDRSYALGLTTALVAHGVTVDFIGSDRVNAPELQGNPRIHFLNLRGDQTESAPLPQKMARLLKYYLRLIKYAFLARPRVFHILWNNKFEWFDRTLLLLYYRLCGRRIVFTAHNVNAGKRDGCDSAWNRFTLGIQYRLVSHLFVHTQRMRGELMTDFRVPSEKISVIPFGINNTTPTTNLDGAAARERLGLHPEHRVALFFGQIAPYKGLEYLVAALPELVRRDPQFRLVIAGKVKQGWEDYWAKLEPLLNDPAVRERVVLRLGHVPDSEVEIYFKGADVLVIPYVHIFQSGVPFLAYSFGLPVVATDVGALREDIVEGKTGLICRPQDPGDLTRAVTDYYASKLFEQLAVRRSEIQAFANDKHSWMKVGAITTEVYRKVLTV